MALEKQKTEVRPALKAMEMNMEQQFDVEELRAGEHGSGPTNIRDVGGSEMDLKKFGGLLGIMAGASLPDDAEGAVRPDILDVVKNAVAGKRYAGKKAGTLESTNAAQLLEDSAKYGGNLGYFNDHGLVQRFKKDGWTSEQIAEGYRGIYDSPNTVVIPSVLGKNPVAQEALWNPVGSHDRSWYMPILPYKRGFQTVTMYDPKTSKQNMR